MSLKFTLVTIAIVFVASEIALSSKPDCQKKRRETEDLIRRSGNKSALAIVLPNCNPDNTFAQLQCYQNSEFCLCFDPEGYPKTQPKTKLRECSCLMKRSSELDKVPPSRQGEIQLTTCEPNGLYTAKQCQKDTCYCVNPKTGEKLPGQGGKAVRC